MPVRDRDAYDALPKVELHCHVEGTVRPDTVVELARKNGVTLPTDDPTELLHRLTRDAIARGERLDGLEVTRPTLEEVYLELTSEADSA